MTWIRNSGGAPLIPSSFSLQITGADLEIARLMSSDPAAVYSVQSEFTCSSWTATEYQEAAVLRIKNTAPALSTLVGKTITSVVLSLYRSAGYTSEGGTVYARRVLRSIVPAQLTWNVYSTGNNWGTAGAQGAADVDLSALLGSITVTDTIETMSSSSTGAFVSTLAGWVSGSIANNGLLLFPSFFIDYNTFDGPSGTNPPLITVMYS
jgi:hypothetical protein